ncbi:MAG: metal ABC transporter substrate-binding protein [Thermoplasmata archaeon]
MTLTRTHRALVVAAVVALLALSSGYTVVSLLPARESPARLTIVASFYPLKEFITPLVGSDVRVKTLVSPGEEPHDWEPTLRDVTDLAEADLVVYMHPDFETYVPRLLASLPSPPPTVVTSEGLELLRVQRGAEQEIDPHIWLDPILVQHQVGLILDALIEVDPTFEAEYRMRADVLLSNLSELHEDIVQGLESCELRTFIASHAAFTYFSNRYSLILQAISIDPEVEPVASRLEALIEYALVHNITVIYTEPLVVGGAAEVIAEAIGGTTLPLDPAEGVSSDQSGSPTYFSIMRDNLANLRVGLRCSG